MRKVIALLFVLATLVAIGCASQATLKRGYAAGKVPCAASEIKADNTRMEDLGGSSSFVVECRQQSYACARECTSYNGWGICANAQTSCAAMDPSPPAQKDGAPRDDVSMWQQVTNK